MEGSQEMVAVPSAGPQPSGALAVGARTDFRSKAEQQKSRRIKEAQKAYGRGRTIDVKRTRDKKLRSNLKSLEDKFQTAAIKAKDAEILHEHTSGFLEPETELERTYRVRQDEVEKDVSVATAQKKFDLKLDALGPYMCEYTRNGRQLLLAGRKGHVATMDWREGKLGCELQLNETIRDARWLHNDQYFAVAQKKYCYIYDHNGVELHCLKKHQEVSHLEFLPYHFLLATLVSSTLGGPSIYICAVLLRQIFSRALMVTSNTKTCLPVRLWQRCLRN
jgi:U3 small nucleolar RNA-associated protein 7